jgi:hypothetical protein
MVTCQAQEVRAPPTNHRFVAEIPDRIVLRRHLELQSYGFNRPVRYALLTLIGAFLILGLFNVFGQHPITDTATSAKADLELYAPDRLRGGLLYEARFTIRAHEDLKHAVLRLQSGWAESQQMNTIEPSPVAETSRNGDLIFTLGPVKKGQKYVLFIEFQVNPTNVGRRSADVALYDGDERLLTIERTLKVFP